MRAQRGSLPCQPWLNCMKSTPDPRRGNPVSPLPPVQRTIIYWIGGLLGLLVLSGWVASARLKSPLYRRAIAYGFALVVFASIEGKS